MILLLFHGQESLDPESLVTNRFNHTDHDGRDRELGLRI